MFSLSFSLLLIGLVASDDVWQPDCEDPSYNQCEIGACFHDCPPFQEFPRPFTIGYMGTEFHLHTIHDESYDDYEIISPDDTGERFDASRPTQIVIHGFSESSQAQWVRNMTENLLDHGDYNTIVVDWRRGALPDPLRPLQPVPAASTQVVGVQLYQLMEALRDEKDLQLEDLHCIGFSLGAHACGFFGKRYREDGLTIARISGLDPGNGIYVEPDDTQTRIRLEPEDADFVDIIHTNARGALTSSGVDINCGDVDFWPHRGGTQGGCGIGGIDDICNHRRCTFLFMASIADCAFRGDVCDSYEDMRDGNCYQCSGSNCQYMGFHSPTYNGRGIYYLAPSNNYPHC